MAYHAQQPHFIRERADGRSQRRHRRQRPLPRVFQGGLLTVGQPDGGARAEGLQVQGAVVEQAAGLRVVGQQHLKAAVEAVAVAGDVGAHAATHGILGFEQQHGPPGAVQPGGAGQARHAGPDDDSRMLLIHKSLFFLKALHHFGWQRIGSHRRHGALQLVGVHT